MITCVIGAQIIAILSLPLLLLPLDGFTARAFYQISRANKLKAPEE